MARLRGGSDVLLLVDEHNLTASKLQELSVGISAETAEITGLGGIDSNGNSVIWPDHTPTGMAAGTVEQSGGLFDSAAGSAHHFLRQRPRLGDTPNIGSIALAGNVAGAMLVGVRKLWVKDYKIVAAAPGSSEVHRAEPMYTVSDAVDTLGRIIAPWAEVTTTTAADTDIPAVDLGAAVTAPSLVAHVAGVGTDTVVTITVEHSSDGATFSSFHAFTQTGPGAVVVPRTTQMLQHVRASVITSAPLGNSLARNIQTFHILIGIRL